MEIYAFLVGIIIAIYLVFKFSKTRLEKTRWAYPLFLASFPVYYLVFAIYGNDVEALKIEIWVSLIFFCISICAYLSKQTQLYFAVAIGCLLHAFYDYYHDEFIINAGMPGWWPEFCGAIDLVLGAYLVYLMVIEHNRNLMLGYEKS